MSNPVAHRESSGALVLTSWVPGTWTRPGPTERAGRPKDVVAGLVLTALLVPQGMAYAELAGLPPRHRPLHLDPVPARVRRLRALADPGAGPGLVARSDDRRDDPAPGRARTAIPATAVALASMLALLVGAFMVLAGVAKLGLVADLLSKPTQIGYMNGLALTIVVGQLPKLFGFSVDADGLIGELTGFVQGVTDGRDRRRPRSPSAASRCALILVLQRWLPKIPAVLVAVVLSILLAVASSTWRPRASRSSASFRRASRRSPSRGCPPADLAAARRGRARDRARGPDRHHLDRVGVRRPERPGGARRPGDDRHRRRQHRRRPVPGLPGEHQRISHRGRRAVRCARRSSPAWSAPPPSR